MKKHLIIIVFLGSLLAGFDQPSEGGANGTSVQKYPFRFHTFTSHIYVDAFLNDSLPIRMVYDCAAPFVWLDSTFVDNHYGYESKQTMAFEGIGHGCQPFRGCGAEIGYWKFGYSQGFKNHPRGFRQ